MGRDQGVMIKWGGWGLVVYCQNSNPGKRFPNKCAKEIANKCSKCRSSWTVTLVHKCGWLPLANELDS